VSKTGSVTAHAASFRDPAGFIFSQDGTIYRQVNTDGRADYDHAVSSGLFKKLWDEELLVVHAEVTKTAAFGRDTKRYKLLKPTVIPFISYPYEWTFAQLRDAALLTLRVQKIALEHGMILKDASAYNVQFVGTRPIFIDTLSFAKYEAGKPWEGYKQFCEHFIAPLALGRYDTTDMIQTLRTYLDGVPLAIACALLPRKARFNRGLFSHLYLHNSAQRRHQAGGEAVAARTAERKVSNLAMTGLMASLERTVRVLKPKDAKTQWGDYYTFTNYSDAAFEAKRKLVSGLLTEVKPKPQLVWDLGANNGEFSVLAAGQGAYTVAFDIDTVAVQRAYRNKWPDETAARLLPLVQDLTNPSPGLGWAHAERMSLLERGPVDVVLALALIHHLAIGNNVPLPDVASFLAACGRNVIIEFVPKGDSKVDHLLASREDIFDEYDEQHFEAAMGKHFNIVAKKPVKGSRRTVYLFTER